MKVKDLITEKPIKKIVPKIAECGCMVKRYINEEGAIVTERDWCKSHEAEWRLKRGLVT